MVLALTKKDCLITPKRIQSFKQTLIWLWHVDAWKGSDSDTHKYIQWNLSVLINWTTSTKESLECKKTKHSGSNIPHFINSLFTYYLPWKSDFLLPPHIFQLSMCLPQTFFQHRYHKKCYHHLIFLLSTWKCSLGLWENLLTLDKHNSQQSSKIHTILFWEELLSFPTLLYPFSLAKSFHRKLLEGWGYWQISPSWFFFFHICMES